MSFFFLYGLNVLYLVQQRNYTNTAVNMQKRQTLVHNSEANKIHLRSQNCVNKKLVHVLKFWLSKWKITGNNNKRRR